MDRYCTACHSSALRGSQARHAAPPDLDFDTHDAILAHAVEIDTTTAAGPNAINESMPPIGYPLPTREEREQLAVWLACGMP